MILSNTFLASTSKISQKFNYVFLLIIRFEAVSLLSEQAVFEDQLPPRVGSIIDCKSILPPQKVFCFAPPFKTPLPLGISDDPPWGGYGFFLELHIMVLCSSRKYQHSPTKGFFVLQPPSPHKFLLALYFASKILAFKTPSP